MLLPFVSGFVEQLLMGQQSTRAALLREYTIMGLRTHSAYLYFLLLAIGAVALALGLGRLSARLLASDERALDALWWLTWRWAGSC